MYKTQTYYLIDKECLKNKFWLITWFFLPNFYIVTQKGLDNLYCLFWNILNCVHLKIICLVKQKEIFFGFLSGLSRWIGSSLP